MLDAETLTQLETRSHDTSLDGRYSLAQYYRVKDKIKSLKVRQSTRKWYYNRWKAFNKFLIKFDSIPETWEDRILIYATHLVNHKKKLPTVKSYLSAIRFILFEDGVTLHENKLELGAILQACKLMNSKLYIRLPIQFKLWNALMRKATTLFEQDRGQLYLAKLFRAMMAISYFGLLRVGEMTKGTHQIKARDITYSKNKRKIVVFLHSSKTHTVNDMPQRVEIRQIPQLGENCPVKCIREYLTLRGVSSENEQEPLFVHLDKKPISAEIYRKALRTLLDKVGVASQLYDCHSMRQGRARDLQELGFSVLQICEIGRWSPKSNTVYLYIRQI